VNGEVLLTDDPKVIHPPEPLILESRAAEALKFYAENYDQLFFEALGPGKSPIVLGTKPQTCRFCDRSRPAVTFKKKAHAVPELVGNKRASTLYECDDCNNRFSSFEDDLGKMTLGYRTLSQVRGKNGVPTLTNKGEMSRIEFDGGQLHIKQVLGEGLVSINDDVNQVQIVYDSQPYRPLGVYKCLAKSAFTLLPEDEIQHFPELKQWLREEDVATNKVYSEGNHICSMSFVPGPRPFIQPVAGLFRRKTDVDAPYCVFLLVYGNYSMQIFLPCPSMDARITDRQIQVFVYPHLYQLQPWLASGPIRSSHEDFSAAGRQSFEKKMNLHFDSRSRKSFK
jgi:hypothetical protein